MCRRRGFPELCRFDRLTAAGTLLFRIYARRHRIAFEWDCDPEVLRSASLFGV